MGRSDDWEAMARTIFGESRSEPFQEQVAVAWVIFNRAHQPSWWGDSIKAVCLKPWQFSCWNQGDPNRAIVEAATPEDAAYLTALGVASLVMTGHLPDPTGGATHYYDTSIPEPVWATTMVPTASLGPFKFFKAVQ